MSFEELIEHLSEELHIELIPDNQQTVSILIDDHLTVQIEVDDYKKEFLFIAFIAEVAPGRFREEVFKSALVINDFPARIGTFSYYKEENYFTFHKFISTETPKEEIVNFLTEIIYIAEKWKKALESGKSAPDDLPSKSKNSSLKPFGLKP